MASAPLVLVRSKISLLHGAAEIGHLDERQSGGGGAGPDGDHAVAVLAEDEGFDLAGGQAGFQCDEGAETGGVELRAEADDFARIEFQMIDCEARENVHGIGDDEEDRILFSGGRF